LDEAEKYIGSKDEKMKGIFENTYSFISDFVHPNAPSRFHFMKNYGSKKRVSTSPTTDNDVKMLLNYACMTAALYLLNIQKLLRFDLNSLPKNIRK
jgi:hypothetical protein